MIRYGVLTVLFSLLPPGTTPAEEGALDFDQALRRAESRESALVIDFFTEWCGPCKAFDRDLADPESGVARSLEEVVFVSVDAEKGRGVELAERFSVNGYPTFVVLDSHGELVDRWMGYGGSQDFIGRLNSVVDDMLPIDERRTRFAASPTATDAEKLGAVAQGNGEYREAIDLYRRAEELDANLDLATDIIFAGLLAAQNDESYSAADFAALLEDETDDDSSEFIWRAGYRMLCRVAGENDALRRDFVSRALTHATASENFSDQGREELEILALLHVENEVERALERKEATLPEGWTEDAGELGAYAWWCYENRVELERAEELARRGIELATESAQRAQILYTAARISHARGDDREALVLARRAIDTEPGNAHYRDLHDEMERTLEEPD